jgi:hypothetical protein
MDCPRGIERLLHVGVPANVLHRSTGGGDGNSHQHTAEATQCFITAMDALKLEERDVDSIQPLISDVMARCAPVSIRTAVTSCDVTVRHGCCRAAANCSRDQCTVPVWRVAAAEV